MVEIGKPVDNFKLPATGGKDVSLSDFNGKKVLLYFYPKDNTPGCTTESVAFANAHGILTEGNVVVLGVSRDSVKSHESFKNKFSMPFDLLSDSEETLCNMFNVIQEKNMYGRKIMGVVRSTFLIDEAGTLEKEWRNVKAGVHCAEVLAHLGLSSEGVDLEACRVPNAG